MGLLIRILAIVGGATILYLIIKSVSSNSGGGGFKKCGRCDGQGYWYAARGKETCDWCRGSGKLPKEF